MTRFSSAQKATPALALSVLLLAALTACGGGSNSANTDSVAPSATASNNSSSAATQSADTPALDAAVAAQMARAEALPTYHMAPVLLDEPSLVDVGGTNASARMLPKSVAVDASVADIDTARLSRATLAQRLSDSSEPICQETHPESLCPESNWLLCPPLWVAP